MHDAYYQLVYYQVKATRQPLRAARGEFTNILYAGQGRAATNDLADAAQARFDEDQAMSAYYNTTLAGGKWKGFQLQPKIGYGDVERYGPNAPWQQPELNNVALPDVIYPYLQRIERPGRPDLGVAVDGSDKWWPAERSVRRCCPPSARTRPSRSSTSRCSTAARSRSTTPSRPSVPWVSGHAEGGPRRQAGARHRERRLGARARRGARRCRSRSPGRTARAWSSRPSWTTRPCRAAGRGLRGGRRLRLDRGRPLHAGRAAAGVGWQLIPGIGRTGGRHDALPGHRRRARRRAASGPRLEYEMTTVHHRAR